MGLFDLFCIFVVLSALQPILQQKLLEMQRLRLLARLERQQGSRAIALVHRREIMSWLGVPLMRYVDINNSEAVFRAIQLTAANLPIDLILHTQGGLVLAAGMSAMKAQTLAAQFASGTRTHDYPITALRAAGLGPPVSTSMPKEVYAFMQPFPQPTRTHPSVEYVPVPYGGRLGRDRECLESAWQEVVEPVDPEERP
jgi:Serine dehydrogenase proteinase